ncbi:MAG: hypothetical protein KDD34_07295 [Bdellovibrionales bacterium]|nr:hypothetical protein [Bdellovibrionales bacterium]
MGRTGLWVLSIVLILGATLFGMQNCSQVEFAELQKEGELKKISEENALIIEPQPVKADENTDNENDESGNVSEAGDEGGSAGDVTQTPQQNSNESENPPAAEGDSSSHESGIVGSQDDDSGEESEEGVLACGDLHVKDIIIDIQSIDVKTKEGQSYQLNIGSGPADLLDLARGIDFIPEKNMRIANLRVRLGSENYILTTDEKMYPLRTQSQESAGLLVILNGHKELAKDVTYHLTMDFDPDFQVKKAGGECKLHPNVKATIE